MAMDRPLEGTTASPKGAVRALMAGDRDGLTRKLGAAAVIALLVTGSATFLLLLGLTPLEPTDRIVTGALIVNSALAGLLLFLVVREVWLLIQARRKGRAAARLHIRIIGLFALVAAAPAILVAIVASITLDLGLDRWFEMRTKQIVGASVNVARAYMDESRRTLTGNTISMALDLDRARQVFNLDRTAFEELMTLQAKARGFAAATLLTKEGVARARARVPAPTDLPAARPDMFAAADSGDPVAIPPGETNYIAAMFKLRQIPDAYLYTIVALRREVVDQLRLMQENTQTYAALERDRLPVQLTFAVLYVAVCLIVLLSAIWMGISVVGRLVSPIRRLITAADHVRAGDLGVRVGTEHTEGDLRKLGDTFNTMIVELRNQRDAIVTARDDLDQRARFQDAVLSGVSAAVMGVDREGTVTIANRAACTLLRHQDPAGHRLADLEPALADVLQRAGAAAKDGHHEQIALFLDGRERVLSVQVTLERESVAADDGTHAVVITVDDITELVAAQRSSAWSDVARRIAHEIKNPLTPIQLSAERIRRRFGKYVTEDRDIFDQCTDTIVRQVGDIGRMVDEFAAFARMPKPVLEPHRLAETLNEAVFVQRVAWPDIEFTTDYGGSSLPGRFDNRLMSQVFINLLKNAAEAIEGADDGRVGRIAVVARQTAGELVIDVIDNGRGLPKENRQRLLEPYMTTREKGTGLGLAIVRKILEDHGGRIELLDAPAVADGGQGALVRVILPAATMAGSTPAGSDDQPGQLNAEE